MFYVYILKSKKDGQCYIGSTNDFRKRFKEHNDGKVFSTKARRPFELIYSPSPNTTGVSPWMKARRTLRSFSEGGSLCFGEFRSRYHGRKPMELHYEVYKSEHDARNREKGLKLRSKAFAQLKKRIHESLQ